MSYARIGFVGGLELRLECSGVTTTKARGGTLLEITLDNQAVKQDRFVYMKLADVQYVVFHDGAMS